ncbi:MAG: hypothetical protein ACRD03_17190 [Acidimicrobiales bacterium]
MLTVASWIGTVNAPALAVAHPLVLVALSPRLSFLAVAAGAVAAPSFFLVGLVRLGAADPSHYLIGRHGYGYVSGRVGRRSPRAHRSIERVRSAVGRRGLPLVALRPNGQVLCAAGASGLRPWPVAAADLLGTVCYLALVWITGRSVPGHLVDASVPVTRAFLVVTTGVVACAGAHRVLQRRSERRRAAARRAHPSSGRWRTGQPFPRVPPEAGWAG